MKTKEEIEELAESKFNVAYQPYSKRGYIEGYTQCQEDMLESLLANKLRSLYGDSDKKYTEDDMLKCWNTAFTDALNIDSETYKPIFYLDFIEKLNKQD